MVQTHFNALVGANLRTITGRLQAVAAANAILKHYNLNRRISNLAGNKKNNAARVVYAHRIKSLKNQIGPVFNKLGPHELFLIVTKNS